MRELQAALVALAAAVSGKGGKIAKAVDVERVFRIDHPLGWRIYQVMSSENVLRAVEHVPPTASMQRFLKAASRSPLRAPAELVHRVSEAMERFEEMMRAHAGDRAILETMVSAHLPEVREKQELASKKSTYQGMSDLLGIMVDVDYTAAFWHPSPKDESSVEVVSISGAAGLRKVRPGRYLAMSMIESDDAKPATVTLDGEPIGPNEPDWRLVREFCSESTLKLEIERRGNTTNYWFTGQDVGLQSTVDYVLGAYGPASHPRYRSAKKKMIMLATCSEVPSKRLTKDVFIHRDVYSNVSPQVRVYQTTARGFVSNFLKEDRDQDLVQTHEVVKPIVGGALSASLPGVPRYNEMLKYVFTKRGWDPNAFRTYRLDVQYPVYGFQYLLGFELPEKPSGE